MVELDEFEIPAKDYFWTVFWSQIMYKFWIWAYLMVFLSAWSTVSGTLMFLVIFSVLLSVALLFTSFFNARFYAGNNVALQKRKWTFGNGTYHLVCEDGSEGRGPLNNIIKADISCGYYRLFMDSVYYVPIPVTAFPSEEDRVRFETEILGDKLKNRTISKKKIVVFLVISTVVIGLACLLRSPERIEMLKKERLEQRNRINRHAE